MISRFGWKVPVLVAVIALVGGFGLVTAGLDHDQGKSVIKLSDLADGETRTFGDGEHAVTATREGNLVKLELSGKVGEHMPGGGTITCDVEAENCQVIVVGDGSHMAFSSGEGLSWTSDMDQLEHGDGKVAVFVTKGGEGGTEISKDIHVMAFGSDAGASASASGDANRVVIKLDGDHAFGHGVGIGEGHPMTVWVSDSGKVLRCPEGDTTMKVEQDEIDETFLCPKHGVALEKAKISTGTKQIFVVTEDEDEDH